MQSQSLNIYRKKADPPFSFISYIMRILCEFPSRPENRHVTPAVKRPLSAHDRPIRIHYREVSSALQNAKMRHLRSPASVAAVPTAAGRASAADFACVIGFAQLPPMPSRARQTARAPTRGVKSAQTRKLTLCAVLHLEFVGTMDGEAGNHQSPAAKQTHSNMTGLFAYTLLNAAQRTRGDAVFRHLPVYA